MLTEFASLQLSREELKEIHAALLAHAVIEDEMRRERGLEKVATHELLEKFEMLLGENEERLHALDHVTEDRLWEYSWYVYTDEWAWYRATRDVEQELGSARAQTNEAEFRKLAELKYQKHFSRYVSEIDMREGIKKEKDAKRQPNIKGK